MGFTAYEKKNLNCNAGYKTKQYEVVMCEFHLCNYLDFKKVDTGTVFLVLSS